MVDSELVNQLALKVNPVNGVIKLALNGMEVPRMGKTDVLPITALFPISVPGMKLDTIHTQHAFEVAELNSTRYVIIVGNDLWPSFFKAIPLEYTAGYNAQRFNTSLVPVMLNSSQVNTSLGDNSPVNASLAPVMINAINILPVLQPSMDEMIHATDGLLGIVPITESPQRHTLETDPSVDELFTRNRTLILQQAEPLLAINRAIVGFCNLPQCIVVLHVDPLKCDKLYRKQYKVAEAAKPAVTACIERWFLDGRIELAPAGCPYNNPLTVAPKKNDLGEIVGIRVCLDVRALNDALLVQDRFQLPYIHDVLEAFGGNRIFGEFDLQEAYLQFPMHDDSKPFTAFTWNNTQYVFRGAPFGLSPLPSHFQRMMNYMFGDLPFVLPFLDNLPYGSSSWVEHEGSYLGYHC